MRNLYLNSIIVCITFLIFYFFLFIYTYLDFDNQFKDKFKSLENLLIHEKYSKIIHHTRFDVHLDDYYKNTSENDLIFTYLGKKNKKTKVLLQGDSWFEQINIKGGNANYISYKIFEEFSDNYNVTFINGGTPSYSPSLMNLQLDLLEKDFNISPDIVISFIDQINIGDEFCRYKKNKVYKNNKLIRVNPEDDFKGVGWFNYSEAYVLSHIYYSGKSKPIKTLQLINFKFYSQFKYLKKNITNKFLRLTDNKYKKSKKCYGVEMEKNLINPIKEEIKYFEFVLKEYIEKVIKKNGIKKLILVSFPYKAHFLTDNGKKYKFNMSNLVANTLDEYPTVEHLNFSDILIDNSEFDYKNIWASDGIHLNDYNHANVFIHNILKELKNHIK